MGDRTGLLNGMGTRRDFLVAAGATGLAFLTGCAVNPVTGQQQLMLLDREGEVAMDKEYAPHQLSSDYGKVQDQPLAEYIQGFGNHMAVRTHRPNMPYNFNVVNAAYVNAYAFPGGTIAATRGILVNLDNEAELAALFGHELGHVNARHAAESYTDNVVTSVVLAGISAYAGAQGEEYGMLTQLFGQIAQGALLAHYSRDNEREADALGMEYSVRAGYNPSGMIGLQKMLLDSHESTPSALEMMFSTHPMSQERYDTAVNRAQIQYKQDMNKAVNKERYMDNTANLRAIKGAIQEMQSGNAAMAQNQYHEAEAHFKKALNIAPNDYAGLMMYSECQKAMGNLNRAERLAVAANNVYPNEPGAYNSFGQIALQRGRLDAALNAFRTYDGMLPGNPSITFYQGVTCERMGRKREAAAYYSRFLQGVNQGGEAQHAVSRLSAWGYIK